MIVSPAGFNVIPADKGQDVRNQLNQLAILRELRQLSIPNEILDSSGI